MKTTKENTTAQLASLFESVQGQLASATKLRRAAIDAFNTVGLPTRKNEEYKYAPADKLFAEEIRLAWGTATVDVKKLQAPELSSNKIVLINGVFSKEHSSFKNNSDKTIVTSLINAFEKHSHITEKHFAKYADINGDAFISLNTAFFTDGLFVYVPEGVVEETPYHVINIITTGSVNFISPRHLIVIEKNASAKFIETTITLDTESSAVINTVSEIFVGENARGEYYKLQNFSDHEKQVNNTLVYQSKASYFNTNTITLNATWLRNNLNIVLDAEYCETHLNGLFVTKDNQLIDNHTLVDHRKPNCNSNQLYKGILNDKSTGVFNGKIYVRKDAQKTNAYQSSKNILLSDNATINTKPQLEIYADDVKCSHGSSTGHIDPEALFYLQSRGLSVDSAKKLLMFAFAGDVIEKIELSVFKAFITQLVEKDLH